MKPNKNYLKFGILQFIPRSIWLVIVYMALFLAFCSTIYIVARTYVINKAEQEIEDLLLQHRGIHQYIQRNMHPELYRLQDAGEILQSVYSPVLFSSSYMVRNIHNYFNEEQEKAGLDKIYYKMAADNPRNPVNKADPKEQQILRMFNENRELTEYRDIVEIDGRLYLQLALPFLTTNKDCLKCHGRREDAPSQLQDLYKSMGGFGDKVGNIRAIESIRAPLDDRLNMANIVLIAAGIIGLGFMALVGLNYRLRSMVAIQTGKLQDSEEKFRAAFESAQDCILIWDKDYNYVYANQAAINHVGTTRDKVIGKNIRDGLGHIPDFMHLWMDRIDQVFETEKGCLVQDETTIKDKHYFTESVITPICKEDGKVTAVCVVYRDVTERKQAEKELAAFNKAMVGREKRILEMKRKVNELSSELGREPVYDEKTSVNDDIESQKEWDKESEHNSDIGDIKLINRFDMDALKHVFESFCDSVGVASAIIDLDGNIIISANWQRICTDFHRVNENSCLRCIKSDTELANLLKERKKYSLYKCQNSMTDAASPIIIEGHHVANAFIGQFHTSDPDEKVFHAQAIEFGFDEEDYLRALHEAPIISEEKLPSILNFLTSIAEVSGIMYLDKSRAEKTSLSLQGKQSDLKAQRQAALSLMEDARRAEDDLRRLRNYLSNIIDSMPSILVGVDTEGNVTQWNSKAVQVTSISQKEAVGQPLEQVFPRLTKEMRRVHEAIQSRKTLLNRKQIHKENNETRYEDLTIYPLIANGVEGAVIRVDDVTERVRIEEMMVQSEKMLSVGGLAAGMAHEINNPLAGMIQTADVMRNRLTNMELPSNQLAAQKAGISMEAINAFMKDRDVPEMLERIHESGKRAAEIVSNMLSFARKSDSSSSTHNLAELLDQTVDLAGSDYDLKKKFDFRQIEIIREYEDVLPLTPCESSKIQQVLLNILRNGAEAMQKEMNNNRELDKKPHFILRLAHEREAGMIRIEIEDNGSGMDEATRKRVFEPFFTTKPTNQGTGLGLSVSYFIITENHGGEMSVESTIGEGTKFIIRLPLE